MYEDKDYCCPGCGKDSYECETTDWYSYICPDCGIEFETPDT
jgi:predicted amidophosphoribosyltransferase